MGLLYNGYRITPAPLVTLSKEYINTGDGRPISANYSVSLRGTLLPNRGSPNSAIATSGLNCFETSSTNPDENWATDDDKFKSILRKQEALRELFSNNGYALEWQPGNGAPGIKFYPNVNGISFDQAVWVERCDYEIRLSANKIFSLAGISLDDNFGSELNAFNLKSASDSFTLSEVTDGSENFQLSRTVSATAFFQRNTAVGSTDPSPTDPLSGSVSPTAQEPWEYAKQWVKNKVGTSYDLESAFKTVLENRTIQIPDFGSSTYAAYSRVRSEQVDRLGGSYSLTDTWVLSQNSAIEDYTVTHETTTPYTNGGVENPVGAKNTYTFSGTVTGLQSDTAGGEYGSKWDNALEHFNTNILDSGASGNAKFALIIEKIANAVGLTYNASFLARLGIPDSYTTSRNTRIGTIQFTFIFTDRKLLNSNRFQSLQLTVQENNHERELAIIPIPGRGEGPIIQNLGTQTIRHRNVSALFTLIASSTVANTNGMWRQADLDGATGIRQEAVKILNGTTQNGIYSIIPTGTEGTDWWLSNFSDTLDPLSNTYSLNAVFTIKGTTDAQDFGDIGT